MRSSGNAPLRSAVLLAVVAAILLIAPTAGATGCEPVPEADCRGADMRHLGNAMRGADMRGADMRGADMRGMSMNGVDFRGADLRGARIGGASMVGAAMDGANLSGMAMSGVDLRRVSLVGANLARARIVKAAMRGASLTGANLRGARFVGGDLTGVNFSHAAMGEKRRTRAGCAARTVYIGSNVGTIFEKKLKLDGSVWQGVDASCARFNAVSWWGALFASSNFNATDYRNGQNGSESIVVVSTSFVGATFNDKFWKPALAFNVDLSSADCPSISGDQSNNVWGRFDYITPHWDGTNYVWGNVTSTAYNDYTYAANPKPVRLAEWQRNWVNTGQALAHPWFSLASTNCAAQERPDWQGGGY